MTPMAATAAPSIVIPLPGDAAGAEVLIAKGGKPTALVKGEPLENPVGVAWHDGTLWVADPRAKMVYRLTDEGKLEPVWK